MLVGLYSGGYCGDYSRSREIQWSSGFGVLDPEFHNRREWLYNCVGDRRLLSPTLELCSHKREERFSRLPFSLSNLKDIGDSRMVHHVKV